MAEPRIDETQQLEFTVKIRSFGRGDREHVHDIAEQLGIGLNRAFGMDRCEIWHNGTHLLFDPLARDGEHIGHDQIIEEQQQ